MSRIKKAVSNEFVNEVTIGLLMMGAIRVNDLTTFHSFEIETIVGKLKINIDTNNVTCFSVFCRFENIELASKKFKCNRFSGKYNLHLSSELDIMDAVDMVYSHIEVTLDQVALDTKLNIV